jgi:hypothetical protein
VPAVLRVGQVDWGHALRLKRRICQHGTAAFAANGYFGKSAVPAHPIMDLASIAYTWLAIVHGNGEAPWDHLETARTYWLDTNGGTGVPHVKAFLERLPPNTQTPPDTWYSWK